jgi:lysyl endopeptidase
VRGARRRCSLKTDFFAPQLVTRTLAAAILSFAASAAHAAAPTFAPDLATLPAVPRVELRAAAVDQALAAPVKNRPYQYAVPVPLALAPRQGVWLGRGAQASWRLRVQSPGALSLSVQLEQVTLPAGAELWVYDPKAQLTHGPYDARRIGRSGLWTPPVSGDELVLEVRGPAAIASALKLGDARVFHGFRDWKVDSKAGAGACNIDITCSSASAWQEDAGSVARISIGGQYLCSGQLLNNVRQDRKKLFLTANHCGIEGEGGPAESVVFYFNYTGPCTSNGTDPLPQPTWEGALRRAHDVQSDFTLLEITDAGPLPTNAYFAGWDATGDDPGSGGVAIHHPGGDEKKIAFHGVVPARETVDIGTGCVVNAWEVQWSEGTTEAGSSGGGLWNGAHRLIGVLSGGAASCANPGGFDYFARLESGWTANAAVDGQLRHWLDPDDTCVATVPGLDPDDPAPGSVTATAGNTRCEGQRSTCSGSGDGGGGALDGLALALLALAARRRSQHDQQHPRDGDR